MAYRNHLLLFSGKKRRLTVFTRSKSKRKAGRARTGSAVVDVVLVQGQVGRVVVDEVLERVAADADVQSVADNSELVSIRKRRADRSITAGQPKREQEKRTPTHRQRTPSQFESSDASVESRPSSDAPAGARSSTESWTRSG